MGLNVTEANSANVVLRYVIALQTAYRPPTARELEGMQDLARGATKRLLAGLNETHVAEAFARPAERYDLDDSRHPVWGAVCDKAGTLEAVIAAADAPDPVDAFTRLLAEVVRDVVALYDPWTPVTAGGA
ncbi:hypothetical protein [Amycolatopsis keratiniphila]|uniref:Uncharacterized protein n=1 Tax=Amycolatopsis keratiniphila subsp. keratiniphila TaxID=227715 RepID=A0A1W2LHE1_9PSEU|nr:hypothetical protein [Amycolatopsis keratiniphila]ONF62275.1 hypothetical protein AVR91_0238590 [Amycolatopsis keratiniphila subsp. keratiniphila]